MAERELTSAPGATRLYPRALAGATVLPVLRRIPGLGSRLPGDGSTLPSDALLLRDVAVDPGRLAEYDRTCGFTLRDTLPVTYPHMLAFPLAMALMTDAAFPFPAIGMVHIRNRIEQRRPIGVGERLTVRVHAENLREHDRGRQLDFLAELSAGEEPVWLSTSTYLRIERRATDGGRKRDAASDDDAEPDAPSAVWRVPGDIGRRYGAVSGDRNPIHMHSLSARLFGMPGAIAHGMWVKARCLAALEGSLPDALAVDVRFKLPLGIPATVAFKTWERDGERRFSVRDMRSGKPHLAGALEPA